jgi:peptide/nickel transport system permease protein
MRILRRAAAALLILICVMALLAPQLAPHGYAEQFRDSPSASASSRFPMGTDALGRDRLSRLIYATRVSLVLAPSAALISIVLAILLSAIAAVRFPLARYTLSGLTTLSLVIPWIFLFITLRALLPLNTSPFESILLTFGLMGVSGWAWPARVFAAEIHAMPRSGWALQARAAGLTSWRIAVVHAWPHLRALALAQFRVLVPAYVLAEASLGLLGLGVAEPLPSWGNLLTELERPDVVKSNPWVLAPLALLVIVMICLEVLAPSKAGAAKEAMA